MPGHLSAPAPAHGFALRPERADGRPRVLVPTGALGAALCAAGIVAGFSTRAGGASSGPLAGANLGASVGDDPEAVRRNRSGVLGALGLSPDLPVASLRQVHGALVLRAGVEVAGGAGGAAVACRWTELTDVVPRPRADGLWTGGDDLALAVYGADCAPVLVAEPAERLVAAVHAGWRGLAAGVVEAGVAALVAAGGVAGRMVGLVGPAAGGCCYEVGADVHDEVAARHPDASSRTRDGRLGLDIAAGAASALRRAGVWRVAAVGGCTIHEAERWFSYRRDRHTGRHAGLIALRSPSEGPWAAPEDPEP